MMSKYISIALLITFGSILLFIILANLLGDEGFITISLIFLLLISIIISLLVKIIDTLNKKSD